MRLRQPLDFALVAWMMGTALFMAGRWEDPHGLWRDTDLLARALVVAIYAPLLVRRVVRARQRARPDGAAIRGGKAAEVSGVAAVWPA